jgi:hypothetical protein
MPGTSWREAGPDHLRTDCREFGISRKPGTGPAIRSDNRAPHPDRLAGRCCRRSGANGREPLRLLLSRAGQASDRQPVGRIWPLGGNVPPGASGPAGPRAAVRAARSPAQSAGREGSRSARKPDALIPGLTAGRATSLPGSTPIPRLVPPRVSPGAGIGVSFAASAVAGLGAGGCGLLPVNR